MLRKALTEFIGQFIHLTEEEARALESISSVRKISKKECFAEIGKVCTKVLFVNRGYFRFYHLDINGNEITSDFYFGPCFITSYTSFITANPSFVNVQAMVDMDVLEFSRSDLYDLYLQHPSIERLGRMVAETVAIASEEHLFLLLNQSAEMRYKRLMERNPDYVNTIPLQYIASYLGITKETLSRMRKAIK